MNRTTRLIMTVLLVMVLLLTAGCGNREDRSAESVDYRGTYAGYSWGGEVKGTSMEDASSVIETILRLESDGTIESVRMRFWVTKDGYKIPRQSGNASVSIDYAATPTSAVPGSAYTPGTSMFRVYTADMMSFYATGVNNNRTTAVLLVDPITRYQMEMKFEPGFDYSMPMSQVTIGSGLMVPTIRTSGSGYIKPESWETFADNTIFDLHPDYSHVVNDLGELAGLNKESTVKDLATALGVQFSNGRPEPRAAAYGYFGRGGWSGNYDAIEAYLEGKNATQVTSLVNWSVPEFAKGVNEKRQFGVESVSGATRTAQWSVNGISGATVRMSRESTSYQRALVDAGILSEEDVIIGRF